MLAAIVTSVAQTGFLFLPEKVQPQLSHLDPIQGLQRIFSLAGAVRLALRHAQGADRGGRGLLQPGRSLAKHPGHDRHGAAADGRPDERAAALDRAEDRLRSVALGRAGLRLSVVEAGAGPADDAAGSARGDEGPARRSAGDRPPPQRAAAVGLEPTDDDGAQGGRDDHQPDGAGDHDPVRRRRR